MNLIEMTLRSPHGAKRNAGKPVPDYGASRLHPGYFWGSRLYQHARGLQRRAPLTAFLRA
jgi:hypothetical protein